MSTQPSRAAGPAAPPQPAQQPTGAAVAVPLLEDDLSSHGVIHPPEVITGIDMPEAVVLCFFTELLEAVAARPDATVLARLEWAHGTHPVYEINHHGARLAVAHPGVGAPLAAGILEDLIALGGRRFVTIGGAGALVSGLALGMPIVVDSAVRDEGTSLHYAPPGRVIEADPRGVGAVQQALTRAGIEYRTGRAWTTDGVYRETRSRVSRRVAEGCIAVEMEASALIAVARYRQVELAALLYAGDSLAGEKWDERSWSSAHDVRHSLFWVAADAAVSGSAADPEP